MRRQLQSDRAMYSRHFCKLSYIFVVSTSQGVLGAYLLNFTAAMSTWNTETTLRTAKVTAKYVYSPAYSKMW
jgi:hypothetical protein